MPRRGAESSIPAMSQHTVPNVTAVEVLRYLDGLHEARAIAALTPLADDPRYTSDLDEEITATQHALIGVAVTEIATLRGELFGRHEG
jgi:hypothetical protein